MTLRRLAIALGVYEALLALACAVVHRLTSLSRPSRPFAIASEWRGGSLLSRRVVGPEDPPPPGSVLEKAVGESALLAEPDFLLSMSLVAGRDGIAATLGDQTVYVTPDDLLARQAYDHGNSVPALGLSIGVRADDLITLLAERLRTSPGEVRNEAKLRRVRFERIPWSRAVTGETLTREAVRDTAVAAARYLARGQSYDGRFRYFVDAPTNRDIGGYDWPRHAGATYFLAQAAAASKEPELAIAASRGAGLLRDKALARCGDAACIGEESTVEIGSSALTLVALVEIVKTGLDPGYAPLVADLARFLRGQQRADGEFMHEYVRPARHPNDVQYLYFSGEAALALARAHRVTNDPADLAAASRALAHLVGPAWHFFGNRYYFGEEHWTCQVMDELWDRAPSPAALDFCVLWHAYGRRMQIGPGETPYDADGAYGVGPVVTPRLTPVASRCEAGVATRHALAAARPDATQEIAALDDQLRRSLALLVRHAFRPGPTHLFADPDAVYGAIPGSEVDWQLRIDYAQHAGSAMLRWLELP